MIRRNDNLPHTYYVYGAKLRSEIPLSLPEQGCSDLTEVELRTAPVGYFAESIKGVSLQQGAGSWYQVGRLADGCSYVRWEKVGEFLVSSDGKLIYCRQFDAATQESFEVYLLGRAFSFALVQSGLEPFHGTVVVVNGEALAFLGAGGFGKSTLASYFLSQGHQILTDDLLMLRETPDGVLAYPGPSRIKLFPRTARRFLLDAAAGVRMNPDTQKLIIPIKPAAKCTTPVPVRAVYAMAPPREVFRKQSMRSELLSPRSGFLELVKNTFNDHVLDSPRMQRQISATARLANLLPIYRLSIPRDLARLPVLAEAMLSDLKPESLETACAF